LTALTPAFPIFTLKTMEVHLSPEKEARLQQVATRTGKNAAQIVEEAVDRMLEYDTRFIQAVEEGRASARRGDLLEHDDVVERIEQMFRS
jgi:predicted transcriptional regulator